MGDADIMMEIPCWGDPERIFEVIYDPTACRGAEFNDEKFIRLGDFSKYESSDLEIYSSIDKKSEFIVKHLLHGMPNFWYFCSCNEHFSHCFSKLIDLSKKFDEMLCHSPK